MPLALRKVILMTDCLYTDGQETLLRKLIERERAYGTESAFDGSEL